MKYKLSLVIEGRVVKTKEIKHKGGRSMGILTLKEHADQMYFAVVDPKKGRGYSYYPPAKLTVRIVSLNVERKFARREGSNAAGFPDLWVEQETAAVNLSEALGSGDENLIRQALELPAVQTGKRHRPGSIF